MLFNISNFTEKTLIPMDIDGYILPHAGTAYTGNILSHTLRFIPKKKIKKIIILYYPVLNKENIKENNKSYYHEYYVIYKTLKYIITNFWRLDFSKIKIIGYNVRDYGNTLSKFKKVIKCKNILNNTLIIASVDFSHHLLLHEAIEIENKCANAIMLRSLNLDILKHVDNINTIKLLYKILSKNNILKWIGRTRSTNIRGVGYLSFLILNKKRLFNNFNNPSGIFVTAYDISMNHRECLGNWFNNNNLYSKDKENTLVSDVLTKATTTSRLTSGRHLDIPVQYYTITYLFEDNVNSFIRGLHGIKHNSFYLSDVFLENTFNNGRWITSRNRQWPKNNNFNMSNTISKLKTKASNNSNKKIELYVCLPSFNKV